MRSRPLVLTLLAVAALAALGGCGGGGAGDGGVVTGRVVSITADRYCVSPDRGETRTCVDVPDARAIEGIDVGECVETTRDLTSEGSRVAVVPEAACASGDLGDGSD